MLIFNRDELYNNINVRYFFDYVSHFNTQANTVKNINIFTGRQLMEEIIIECNGNALNRNEENNKMLCRKIDILINSNYFVDAPKKKVLNYLKEQIFKKNSDLVLSICKNMKEDFEKKEYFDFLVDNLILLLEDDSKDNSSEIKEITDFIFIELRNNGYEYRNIKSKIFNLLSDSKIDNQNPERLDTLFPYRLISNYKKKTYDKLNTFINNLDIFQRIEFIKKFYNSKVETYYLIVPISGIVVKGKKVVCNSEITLYNPTIESIIKSNKKVVFKENIEEIDYSKCCNACVKVRAKTSSSAYIEGLKKLENFLNLQVLISDDDNGYKIIKKKLALLDNKKKDIGLKIINFENEVSRKQFLSERNPIKAESFLDQDNIDFNKIISELIYRDDKLKTKTDNLLINSIKKYSEALNSSNKQESILKYWSSIESLFCEDLKIEDKTKAYDLIKEFLPIFYTYGLRYRQVNNVFNEIMNISNLGSSIDAKYKETNRINFPESLIKDIIKLDRNKTMSLKPFVLNIKAMEAYVNGIFYFNKLEELYRIFNDKNYAVKDFNKQKEMNTDNLTNIYRLRNQIIHNALSNEYTTEHYLPILKSMAETFLYQVLEKYSENNNLNINQIILELYAEANIYIKKMDEEKLINLLF